MMILQSDDCQQIARLFDFFLQGEKLAFECSSKQIQFFDDAVSKKFLTNQARQEKFHCRVFKSGVGILAPRGFSTELGKKEWQDYSRLINEALQRGDKAESLLGMQIMLEGLGDVSVKHISSGFNSRKVGYMCRRVRHLILGQEDAHHIFGMNKFSELYPDQAIPNYLIARSQDYFELLDKLMYSVADLFHYFDQSSEQYMQEFYSELPEWITENRL